MDNYSKCKRFFHIVAKRCGGEIVESKTTNSIYLKVSGKTIRLSDHTTNQQTDAAGFVSIIVPDNKSDMFALMLNGNSSMSIVNYKRIKDLVNTFSNIPHAFGCKIVNEYNVENVVKDVKSEGTVLGIPKEMFNENQLRIITQTAKKVASENNVRFKL